MSLTHHRTHSLIEAAQGKRKCDLLIKNARYLDVFSCRWQHGDVAVFDGHIVGIDSDLRLPTQQSMDLRGQALVPGWLDAHVHIESSLLTPHAFAQAVLPRGTTSVVADPHEIANVQGLAGIQYFLDAATTSPLRTWIMLSSCVPATTFETNGGGALSARDLAPLADHPHVLGLAEMMNYPGVLAGDPDVLAKIEAFANLRIDGHAPMVTGTDLSAYAAAGITSCHESSTLAEAEEKLRKGMAVWIREGSVAKDLHTLLPLLSLATSTGLGLCTDDRNPLDIAEEGHLDYLLREAIRHGVPPEVAFRAASHSVARHYNLDRATRRATHSQKSPRLGAIAPGYAADLVWLSDVDAVGIERVWIAGKDVREQAALDFAAAATPFENSIHASIPSASELVAPQPRDRSTRVIGVIAGKIVTESLTLSPATPGVHHISVLCRHRTPEARKPANAYVHGFGTEFQGALASSVGHDSHNLIAIGSNTEDMVVAWKALQQVGGGFVAVQKGQVLSILALPIAGLMTQADPATVATSLKHLRATTREMGCELAEPFLQMAFLSLPVIPHLKITDRGLFDVDRFELVG